MSESYIGPAPKSGFISTAIQRVTGSTNNYVDLDHSISSLSECIVWLNNVKQDTNSLTLTTSTRITLGGTLVSGDVVQILFVAKAVSTQAPATGQVTLDMLSASGTKNNTTFLRGDNTFATAGESNTPNFRVRLNSNQSISNTTWTKVTWDTEDWDSDTAFASNKFTVPSGQAGKYLFYASVSLDSVDDSLIGYTKIYKNGSGIDIGRGSESWGSNNKSISVPGLWMEDASASDYYEIYAYHDNGDTRNIESAYSYFGGFKIS